MLVLFRKLFVRIRNFFDVSYWKFVLELILLGLFNYFTFQVYLLDTRFQLEFSKIALSDFFELFYQSNAVLAFYLAILFLFIFIPLSLFSVLWILFRLIKK